MDAKYLGVTLSNDLEWSKHIATMTNKANSKLLFLRHNPKDCPEKLKQTAYFYAVDIGVLINTLYANIQRCNLW